MKRKLLWAITILFLLGILNAGICFSATSKQYAVIINLAGKQRMLTQKISKEILLVSKSIDADKNRENLKATSDLFDKTLKGLIKGDKSLGLPATENKKILIVLKKVTALWEKFKSVVNSVKDGGDVPVDNVAKLNLPLLKNMNTAVRLYEKEAAKQTGKKAGTVINLAGKQRMLTQKMSKEMLLFSLNHDGKKNKMNLKKTASLFDRTLKGLKDGDKDLDLPGTSDNAINEQLDKVKSLWNDFKPLIDKLTDIDNNEVSNEDLKSMANINLPLLKEMNKAVKMYEEGYK